MTQIKKAKGLNKKIMNPMLEQRKTVLDFCYLQEDQGAIALKKWLDRYNYAQENCGLVNIPHMKDVYGVYYDEKELSYQGIVRPKTVDTLVLSSIPKEAVQKAILYFNKDGYKKYCKDYKNYWDWVNKRNDTRYENTIAHGKNYDSKNMMHTFRLLDMAIEILGSGQINVKRSNRAELLSIRKGDFLYDDLIVKSEEKVQQIEMLYLRSPLPKQPNKAKIKTILIEIRKAFYQVK
jgi:hypothetical protein